MANLTVQDLQNIAVNATTEFLNNKCSLNESLAKQASDRGLNSEQLKRAVEATNTLTHLKTLELSLDKTAEFPVADYKTILKMASVPDSGPEEGDESGFGFFGKQASTEAASSWDLSVDVEVSSSQAKHHLLKFASANDRQIELLQGQLEVTSKRFLEKVAQLKADPQAHEFLSASSATDLEYTLLSKSVFGEVKPRCNFAEGMFKSASLRSTEELIYMIKEAQVIREELRGRLKDKERADASIVTLTKQAFLEGTVRGATKGIVKAVTYIPRKIGAAIGSTASAVTTNAAKGVHNAAADTSIGKGLGMKPTAIDPKISKRAKMVVPALGFAAGAATDVAMFQPKVDPAKDKSGDVWDALQS